MYIKMLLEYKKHLSKLEDEIDALAKSIEEYEITRSIPGIGEKIAATIISEIGKIERFNDPKKLVVFESGTFKGTQNRKQKTTDEIIPRNKRIRAFCDKKREEGKPYKVELITCIN